METIDIDKEKLKAFYQTISNNIVKIRKEKNISQLDLATSIGHSSSTFLGKAEILSENKHFNLEHLYKIATALNVDICEFFKDISTSYKTAD